MYARLPYRQGRAGDGRHFRPAEGTVEEGEREVNARVGESTSTDAVESRAHRRVDTTFRCVPVVIAARRRADRPVGRVQGPSVAAPAR